MNAAVTTKRQAIEARYRMDIRAVVSRLYRRFGNLEQVAETLEVSRQSLYTWLGKREIAMLKAQAGMRELGEDRDIQVGSLN